MNKEIEKELEKHYNVIIKNIELPFYNDLFIKYIIGKNNKIKLKTIDDNLNIEPQYYDKYEFYSTDYIDNFKYSKLYTKLFALEKIKSFQIIRNIIIKEYSPYYNIQEFMHLHDCIKQINYKNIKSIDYVVITTYFNKDKIKKVKQINKKISDYFNFKINTIMIDMNDNYLEKINKLKSNCIYLKIVSNFGELIIQKINNLMLNLTNYILNNKNKKIIFDVKYDNKIFLLMDIITICQKYYNNIVLYSTKYHFAKTFVIILQDKKDSINVKYNNKKIIYRLLNINNIQFKNFLENCLADYINKMYGYYSIIQKEVSDKKSNKLIKKKLLNFREYLDYDYLLNY